LGTFGEANETSYTYEVIDEIPRKMFPENDSIAKKARTGYDELGSEVAVPSGCGHCEEPIHHGGTEDAENSLGIVLKEPEAKSNLVFLRSDASRH
jgi:hypothetical protein